MFYNNKAMKYLWRIISALIFILAIVGILFGALKKKYLLSSILTVIGGVSPFLLQLITTWQIISLILELLFILLILWLTPLALFI